MSFFNESNFHTLKRIIDSNRMKNIRGKLKFVGIRIGTKSCKMIFNILWKIRCNSNLNVGEGMNITKMVKGRVLEFGHVDKIPAAEEKQRHRRWKGQTPFHISPLPLFHVHHHISFHLSQKARGLSSSSRF
jgi:hypothetical protein